MPYQRQAVRRRSPTAPPPTLRDRIGSPVRMVRMTDKRRSVVKRFFKVFVYTVIGSVLAVAGYVAVAFLTDQQLPGWLITTIGFFVSGLAASIHKSINWKETGAVELPVAELPMMQTPTLPAPTMGPPESQGAA